MLHDTNVRRQLARERVDELARDFRRAQNAATHERPEAQHTVLVALLQRLRKRKPEVAAQRP